LVRELRPQDDRRFSRCKKISRATLAGAATAASVQPFYGGASSSDALRRAIDRYDGGLLDAQIPTG